MQFWLRTITNAMDWIAAWSRSPPMPGCTLSFVMMGEALPDRCGNWELGVMLLASESLICEIDCSE